jgi:hypothetical protein
MQADSKYVQVGIKTKHIVAYHKTTDLEIYNSILYFSSWEKILDRNIDNMAVLF